MMNMMLPIKKPQALNASSWNFDGSCPWSSPSRQLEMQNRNDCHRQVPHAEKIPEKLNVPRDRVIIKLAKLP